MGFYTGKNNVYKEAEKAGVGMRETGWTDFKFFHPCNCPKHSSDNK
jgi:hypothetical protein